MLAILYPKIVLRIKKLVYTSFRNFKYVAEPKDSIFLARNFDTTVFKGFRKVKWILDNECLKKNINDKNIINRLYTRSNFQLSCGAEKY